MNTKLDMIKLVQHSKVKPEYSSPYLNRQLKGYQPIIIIQTPKMAL